MSARLDYMTRWHFIPFLLLQSACTTRRPAPVQHHGIAYVSGGHERQSGDLWLPQGEGPWPVIVMVHGGGWTRRDRSDMDSRADWFSRRGFAVFNINYRLAPEHRFPAQLNDMQSALKHLRVLAETHPLDLERVGLYGYSAGGHLVLLAATHPTAGAPPVRAVVAGGSPTDVSVYPRSPFLIALIGGTPEQDPDAYFAASPRNFITADHPPTLLYHGTLDLLVERTQSRDYFRRLQQYGVRSRLMPRRLYGHLATFQFDRPTRRAALRHFETFMPAEEPSPDSGSHPPSP